MITKCGYTMKQDVCNYLEKKQYKRVLDVGGAMNPWARKYVTHYLDLFDPKAYHQDMIINDADLQRSISFIGDVCSTKGWDEVIENKCNNGKFDFVICSQILEDIRNPDLPLQMMPIIAKEGYISVPTKGIELSKDVEAYGEKEGWGFKGAYRGYCHHRWIFTVIDSELILIPKLNFLETLEGIDQPNPLGAGDLSIFWKEDIPFKFINNDFLGPNPPHIFSLYREFLNKGL